ncbi:MAG TPA: YCF48-related protein [Chloroflexota bacterium]
MSWLSTPAWRQLTPALGYGGSVSALACAPTFNREPLVLAGTTAGLHRSVDGGRSWTTVFADVLTPAIQAIVFSPGFAHDRTVFATSQEAGLLRSTDGGETWRVLSPRQRTGRLTCLAVSPGLTEDGTLLVGTEDVGVARSTDGGRTWSPSNFGLQDLTVLALAVAPTFITEELVLLAGVEGLYRSTNGGRAWRSVPDLDGVAVQAIAFSPHFARDRTVFVGTEGDGVWRSTDGGARWEPLGLQGLTINALAATPRGPDGVQVLAGVAEGGLYRTRDRDGTWDGVAPELPSVLALASSPDGGVLVAGLHLAGVYRSADGGASWHLSNEGLCGRALVSLAVSPQPDETVFVAGLEHGALRSTDGGKTWDVLTDGLPDLAVGNLACARTADASPVVFGLAGGRACRIRGTERRWTVLDGAPADCRALAVSPSFAEDGAVYVGCADGRVHRSTDGGERWEALPPPEEGAQIVALACSPRHAHDRTLVVGTASNHEGDWWTLGVWRGPRVRDGWECVLSHRAFAPWMALAIPSDFRGDAPESNTCFVATPNGLVRPMWQGKNLWVREPIGPSRTTPLALVVTEGPRWGRQLFAATTRGVWTSTSEGMSWQLLEGGPGEVPVVALCLVSGRDATRPGLLALALGGVLWRWN